MIDDDRPRAEAAPAGTASHQLGQPLDTLSLAELDERIALLHTEIQRLEAARTTKAASLAAADAFFKKEG